MGEQAGDPVKLMATNRPYEVKEVGIFKPQQPKFFAQLPDTGSGQGHQYNPLYPFGYGLSYTTFTFENLRLERDEIRVGESTRVLVDVEHAPDILEDRDEIEAPGDAILEGHPCRVGAHAQRDPRGFIVVDAQRRDGAGGCVSCVGFRPAFPARQA